MYDWDPNKAGANAAKHGVAFEAAAGFEWDTAIEARDARRAYDEARTVALGFIGDRLRVLVFARRGRRIRIISLRKANMREVQRYVAF